MDLCREKKVQQRDIQRCIKRQRHMGDKEIGRKKT